MLFAKQLDWNNKKRVAFSLRNCFLDKTFVEQDTYLSQERNIMSEPPVRSETFTPSCDPMFAINCATSHVEGTWNFNVIYNTEHS